MKTISIRELHARTGHWVRQVSEHGEIQVTDSGRVVAKLSPERERESVPFFARRKPSKAFKELSSSGRLRKGTDSTKAISEEREDREE